MPQLSTGRSRHLRPVVQSIALIAGLAALLFGSAGRADWAAGWILLGLSSAFILLAFLLVPLDLIIARGRLESGIDRRDSFVATAGGLCIYPATFVLAGIDAGRAGWSAELPAFAQALGFLGFVAGYGFALWAMRCNPFFETFVRIQKERGHRLVDTGPYARVRHPGYTGVVVAHLALPFALGSLVALVPSALGVALFALRTWLEDETLSRELAGYAEYRSRVRWRLVPGVW